MAVTYKMHPEAGIFELTVTGKIADADFDALTGPLDAFVKTHGKIKLLEIIKDFQGFDPMLMWRGAKYDLHILPKITHCAVVSDMGWISPLAKAAGAFVSTRLRTFDLSEEEAAREWLDGAE